MRATPESAIHVFENGLKVYESHLTRNQKQRYKIRNVHEFPEEHFFEELIRSLNRSDCYVNVGGGYGYYPILARLLRDDLRICCLEPLKRHYSYIESNLLLNGLARKDLDLLSEAVSAQRGVLSFVDLNYGSFILNEFTAAIPYWARHTTVDAIPLADLVRKYGRIGLLHMDIQGHEFCVLSEFFRTAPKSERIRRAFVATHDIATHFGCNKVLEENGFAVVQSVECQAGIRDGFLVAVRNES